MKKRSANLLGYKIALTLFTAGLFLSVSAVNYQVATLPVRAILITAAFGLYVWQSPESLGQSIHSNIKLLAIIMISAVIGMVVSLLNGNSISEIFRQITEIHIQAIICLLLATMLATRFTAPIIGYIFIGVWACTAIVALLQFAGVESAWQLRAWLGALMDDPQITRQFYERKERVLGLSFTPVHLATQTVLAFAVFFTMRIQTTSGAALRRVDAPIILALLLATLTCVISGNRSPLLGFAAFSVIYTLFVAPRMVLLAAPLLVIATVVGPSLVTILADHGLRIASMDDGSATGRETLARYGLLLLLENPMGYGLVFNSTTHAGAYLHSLAHLDNAVIIRYFTLHNYYLQMLAKYGVLILAVIPLLIPARKISYWAWLAFVPYIVHIFFHNDGPLSSDFLIWFLLPLAAAAVRSVDAEQPDNRKWRRNFYNAAQT